LPLALLLLLLLLLLSNIARAMDVWFVRARGRGGEEWASLPSLYLKRRVCVCARSLASGNAMPPTVR